MDVVFSFMCRKKDSRLVTVAGGLAQEIAHYADEAHRLSAPATLIPQTRSMRCDIMGALDDDSTTLRCGHELSMTDVGVRVGVIAGHSVVQGQAKKCG